jgi:LPS-assembly protein
MMLKKVFIAFFFGLIIFLPASSSSYDGSLPEDQPIEINADSIIYDKDNNMYYAFGNVVVVQGQVSITADKITYDLKGALLTAEGEVEARDEGGNVLTGENLRFKVDEKTAIVTHARIFFKEENVYITGDEIRKTGEETYEIDRGTFTTCDCEEGEKPAWSFYSKSAEIIVGEYINAWNNLLKIKGVPVMYFPYMRAPVKRKRQTGFLTPGLGYSTIRGLKFDNAFFWTISDNTDATFYLDLEARRGLGKGVEYRYIRKRGSEGEFYFYHFKEKDLERVRSFREGISNLSRPTTAQDERWIIRYIHREDMPYGFIFKADVNIVSDDEYFIDFGRSGERSLESLETTVSLSKGWGDYNLVGQVRVFDNLLVGDDRATLQKMPEVTFTRASRSIFGSPFYLSMESSFINFEREEGIEGQRLDIYPRLLLPMNPGGYFEITPSIAPRETFYWSKKNPEGKYQDRFIYDIRVDLTTTFIKVISLKNISNGLQKLRHTIRPKVTYTYIPEQIQDYLPSYDAMDRTARRNEIVYSVNSIMTGRFKNNNEVTYRDYIYLDLSQSYNIVEAARELVSPGDERRPFSDVSGELRIEPAWWTSITAKGKYDPYNGWMEDYDASLGLHDKRGDNLNLSHRFIRDTNEYLDISAGVKVLGSLDLTYRNRYSYNTKKSIETVYKMKYKTQCWNSELTYTARIDENIVLLTFDLLGIGRVGGLSSTFESR